MELVAGPGAIQLPQNINIEQLGGKLRSEVDEAQAARSAYLREIEDNRELLKAKRPPANPRWKGACELTLPVAKYIINALEARLTKALLRPSPLFNVEARGPRWRDAAPRLEAFLDLQTVGAMGLPEIGEKVIRGALIDGSVVAYVWWDTQFRQRRRWTRKEGRWERVEETVEVYDGPAVTPIPVERVGTWPAQDADLQRSTGAYLIYRATGDDLLNGAERGIYDQSAVAKMRERGADVTAAATYEDQARLLSRTSALTEDDFRTRNYVLVEYHRRFATSETGPAQEWVFVFHRSSGTILQAMPNPWGHGLRPLVVFRPLADRFGILGDSVIDLVGPIQEAITTLLRLVIDATAMGILPEMLVAPHLGQDMIEELKRMRGPGGLIPFDPAYRDAVQQFMRTGFNPTAARLLIEDLRQWIERATTISDINLGRITPRDITATQFTGTLEESEVLPSLMIDRMSASFSMVAELVRQLDYEFADRDSVQALWRLATGDEETPGLVGLEELGGNYDITAAGSRDVTNRAMRIAKAREVMLQVEADPLATPAQKYAARRDYYNELGVRNVEAYLGTEEEYTSARYRQDVQAAAAAMLEAAAKAARPGSAAAGMPPVAAELAMPEATA